jgi:hypothetical protein
MIGSTVITARYAPYARVLGRSFLEHHPGARFAVLVADDVDGALELDDGFETLRPGDVGIDDAELHRRALAFDGQGLTCSMKAALLRHLLAHGEDVALLLDADSYVYGDLEELGGLAQRHGTIITPHSTVPHDDIDVDRMIIRTGAFNAGLLAVGRGARPFLDWWHARIARRCIPEPGTGVFNEQAWLDLVPGLFDHHVLRDPGCNASGFAMHYRDVVWRNGMPALPDGPLRHFHFLCGFDPHRPELLTTVPAIGAHWPSLKERPGLARLARDYAERLLAAGYDEARTAAAPFDRLPDGHETNRLMRCLYRDALIEADATEAPEPPNPWDAGTAPFLAWLNQPLGGPPPEASRYLLALWAERPDLMAAFPRVPGADSGAYLAWAATKSDADHDHIPAALAPARPEAAATAPAGPEATRALAAERDQLARDFNVLRGSRSWRLTAPARFAAGLLRAARARRRPPRTGA